MGNLIAELKGKLEKSKPRTMMFAALCSDNKFVAKVLNEFPFKEVCNKLSATSVTFTTSIDDIAHYAILSLKDVPAGKGVDSVKKARPFLEGVASLMYEDRDTLGLDEYCSAVHHLRELQSLVLPADLVIDPNKGTDSDKVKTFKVPNGKKPPEDNFLVSELHKAEEWMDKVSKGGETMAIVEARDKDMVACAKKISQKISSDSFLSKKYGTQNVTFSNWAAEQIYGCRPETVESIKAIKENDGLISDLFNQFVQNLTASNPNEFIRVLATIVHENPDKFIDAPLGEFVPAVVTGSKVKTIVETKKADIMKGKKEAEDGDDNQTILRILHKNIRAQFADCKLPDKKEESVESWWNKHLENAHKGTTASLNRQSKVAATAAM